jgi:ABC-type multidrug transport system ATPase subunit
VYGLGGTLVIHGVFQVGTLVAFIALVSQLYGPLHEVSSLPVDILTALVSFDRVFEILDLEPLITERATAFPLPGADGAPGVEVEGVWFRYPEADQVSLASLESVALPAPERPSDAWVLRDVTFQVPAGRLTALVGPSGAGKTTITHLVPRLYDPVRGAVRIGGHDVRDLTLESLRSVVGVVPQDAHLFHDTIRANLLYARPSATEKELTEVCQAARIWKVISSLPDGLDTIAGDRGYRFSGGEKQRLALARLLLKAPSVVVLDEATAHLDSESEVAIQRALATALAGRTSLVIAHRLSTVRAADQILVVDGGQIAERGTHDELLAAGGVYAGLYRTQFAAQAALRSFPEEGNISCANAGNYTTITTCNADDKVPACSSPACGYLSGCRSRGGTRPAAVLLEVLEEPVVDLADSADHGEMAVAVADISLRARDAGGQPLAVLHGNKPVLAAVPDLDGHPDVAEIEPPAGQGCRFVIPPALVARGEGDLLGLGEPSGQVPGQDLGVDGRQEALDRFSELLRRGREDLLPVLAQIAAKCLRGRRRTT